MTQSFDICRIIGSCQIETHFQPITSIRKKQVIGVEALSRGIGADGLISPFDLFAAAERKNLASRLDEVCRNCALENFVALHEQQPDLILFVNFHASSVAFHCGGARDLAASVSAMNLSPCNMAIEILESAFEDAESLQEAVQE